MTFAQVLARGTVPESVRNPTEGFGIKPKGGIESMPVKKERTSPRVSTTSVDSFFSSWSILDFTFPVYGKIHKEMVKICTK